MKYSIKDLKSVGHEINTQDNLITANPMFLVQRKVKDYGVDPDYGADGYIYTYPDSERVDEDNEIAALEMLDDWDLPEGYSKVYYRERWEFVTACFTRKGCENFIRINGHNIGPSRIYVDSAYRNYEFIGIREWLMELPDSGTSDELSADDYLELVTGGE